MGKLPPALGMAPPMLQDSVNQFPEIKTATTLSTVLSSRPIPKISEGTVAPSTRLTMPFRGK